uniref:uncharacterized protein LOC123455113 n=1 Tax=Jaculus jaculus TaxID=51337 RepID=UPI001E1B00A6|nr:uncharacterized protein LOC123455113 [Jaculus jaculus]
MARRGAGGAGSGRPPRAGRRRRAEGEEEEPRGRGCAEAAVGPGGGPSSAATPPPRTRSPPTPPAARSRGALETALRYSRFAQIGVHLTTTKQAGFLRISCPPRRGGLVLFFEQGERGKERRWVCLRVSSPCRRTTDARTTLCVWLYIPDMRLWHPVNTEELNHIRLCKQRIQIKASQVQQALRTKSGQSQQGCCCQPPRGQGAASITLPAATCDYRLGYCQWGQSPLLICPEFHLQSHYIGSIEDCP